MTEQMKEGVGSLDSAFRTGFIDSKKLKEATRWVLRKTGLSTRPYCQWPFPLGIVARDWQDLEEKAGLQPSFLRMFSNRCRTEVCGLTDVTKNALCRGKKIILISSERGYSDVPMVIGALPLRENDDICGFVSRGFTERVTSQVIKDHIFPIDVNRQTKEEGAVKLWDKISSLFGVQPLGEKQSQMMNYTATREAIRRFKDPYQSTFFVITPEAFRGVGGKWLNGVGYFINAVKDVDDAQMVFTHVKGVSTWDLFRMFAPPVLRHILPELNVYFSSPYSLTSIVKEVQGLPGLKGERLSEKTTGYLELLYERWRISNAESNKHLFDINNYLQNLRQRAEISKLIFF